MTQLRQKAERKLLPNTLLERQYIYKKQKGGRKTRDLASENVEKRGKTMLLGMFYTLNGEHKKRSL